MLNKNLNILIVGLGLLGGSYAKALSEQGYRVGGIARRESDIAYACDHGFISYGAPTPDPALIAAADLVVLALYPATLVTWVEENGKHLRAGAVVTDVTGVKTPVVDRVQSLMPEGVEFIAAHPMAGREVSGLRNADPAIFRGANYVVTPTAKNTPNAITLCEELGKTLGFARISRLSPAEHDEIIAFVSQLTHCIAVSLMTCQQTPHLEDYTGDSFRDLTRIARLNDEMWSELFLANREALLSQIDLFTAELGRLRQRLAEGDRDALREQMRASTARRALFDKKKEN